ncbi:malonyl-ACP O-methyltransferase BioC [Vibrio sagamiensis]|uniref:Malonyl-[acyl-carrier protein] O-methyltransferase n=1 Tax=Vibrio sagamiensis NBRC 104589 TaxID=1219064 RepID=A0A511QIJ8_9VIBR|nr:malonyl-ACP O-methyltransferase BioC [Vibrio sagamiensis]PNQ70431.1 malonyl-[acyl-carrier protein] O-methyltransferase BioC [Vibrio agarivorans]GEM77140.1 malonyl-[acyl-carrier protein] O-methyltransferase [Vibrio sagamiensis NBRC 104589]
MELLEQKRPNHSNDHQYESNLIKFNYNKYNKYAIAHAFGKAAQSYDDHASFQREVGHRLLKKLPSDLSGKKVLDLGGGTGYFSHILLARGAEVVCIDIAQPMLEKARQRCGENGIRYVLADAESLPLADESFDYVFSSLALQWCTDISKPLGEICRVLKVDGKGLFSILLDGSLHELRQSWARVDSHQHVNHFITQNQLNFALAQSESSNYHLESHAITVWYDSAFAVMRDIKGIGANVVRGRSHGLTSYRSLLKVESMYQTFQNDQGLLPATYQVGLGTINL